MRRIDCASRAPGVERRPGRAYNGARQSGLRSEGSDVTSMTDRLTVVLAAPGIDGVASAAIVARCADGPVEMLFMDSCDLPAFFDDPMQQKLPSRYRLLICGLDVVQRNWQGETIRPRLMEALRGSMQPIEWFSAGAWSPEDKAAVEHMIGGGRLHVTAASSCAELVQDALAAGGGAEPIVALAQGRGDDPTTAQWRRVISCLRDDATALARTAASLADEETEHPPADLVERADRVESDLRLAAEAGAGEPVPVGDRRLITLDIPAGRRVFWPEMAREAMRLKEAQFCLCALPAPSTLILTADEAVGIDLRPWARCVTDLMAAVRSVEEAPQAVILSAPDHDPALRSEVVRLLAENAHLLNV